VVSTLDAALQARLEPLAAAYAREQGADATASILVVEVETRAVRALVGSGGLDRQGGWIDMTTALRSPGSALKPFIYAFAFDDGVAAPDTQMQDVATRFNDYQPEDFDRVFRGAVTAREALSHSLNVPAVALMERIGPASFLARMESAGVTLHLPAAETRAPGLALALGGEGVTLRDMAVLYCALGDEGIAKPLAWTEADAARRKRSRGVASGAGGGGASGAGHPARGAAAQGPDSQRPDAGRARHGLQDRHLLRLPRRRRGRGGRRLCDHRLDRAGRRRRAGRVHRPRGGAADAVRRRRHPLRAARRAAAHHAQGRARGPDPAGAAGAGTQPDLPARRRHGAGGRLRVRRRAAWSCRPAGRD
jgi:hypothetical protein